VAEPWDIGPGGYQVGGFPPGWAEWNDQFRDNVRAWWKGDEALAPKLAQCMSASGDRFNHRGRRPWASVNFITAHDGFTLADTVSYNEKHNDANGEDNRDGSSDNRSWNCGVEGDTDDEAVLDLRARQQRNMLATLLLAQGTPMVLAGDEFGRTQQGNNNAYCQDDDISWLHWEIDERGQALNRFTQRLTKLRKELPVLRRGRFLSGDVKEETQLKDVTWLAPDGAEMDSGHWDDPQTRCFGMLLEGTAQASSIARPADDATVMIMINSWQDAIEFKLPARADGVHWSRLIDTALDPQEPEDFEPEAIYTVTGRSMLLFVAAGEKQSADAVAALVASL